MTDVPQDARRVVVEFERSLVESHEAEREHTSWSRTWECSVTAVRLTDDEPSEGDDAFLIGPGDVAHVLVVGYDDGDSYGSETGLLDVVHAFSDLGAAQAAKALYEACTGFEAISFKDDFGREVTMPLSASHNGHFEFRTSIEILSMEIIR
jgi:hypothetical protein